MLTAESCLYILRNVWVACHIRPPSPAMSDQYFFQHLATPIIFTSTETPLYILAPALAQKVEEILLYIMEGQNSSRKHHVKCPFTMISCENCDLLQCEVTHVTTYLHLT